VIEPDGHFTIRRIPMTRRLHIRAIAAAILVAVGIALAVLPGDWIERIIGADPDRGSGLVEFLLPGIPLVIGLGLGLSVLLNDRRHQAVERVTPLRP
jgi:hypothetical protein